ncbi:MAG: 50S ribosomal protein L2 [Phycisphaeraceae bacterium]|nr:50S ribosomal protein L2 [Phycisphaeraceae bacterium]
MAIRIYNKTSAGRRNSSVNLHVEVTKRQPEKSLLVPQHKKLGRNNHGVITVSSRGGGAKKRYRVIDFRRARLDESATVVGIEYDPNRTCHIALLEFADGQRSYILAPVGLQAGDTLVSASEVADPKPGNAMPLARIPSGLSVHNIELIAGRGGQLCRSAGSYARLTNKEGDWATLVFPSGEIRQISLRCRATVGQVGNLDHQSVRLGKAGRSRHIGRRPHTRGVAKNHHNHPLGGGDGKSKHNRPPASKTGVLSKGGRTRKHDKPSDARIIRRRRSVRYGQLVL